MKRSLPVLFFALATAARAQEPAAPPSPAPPAPPAADAATPTFAAGVEVVTVDVVVTDKKNVTLSGLPREEFTILEDGVPQEITSFDNVQVPAGPSAEPARKPAISDNTVREERTGRSFIIVFDDVHLTLFQAHRAKLAIGKFLETGVREGDRVTLVATGGGAWWSTRMEAGREDIVSLLKRLEGRLVPDNSPERMSDSEALRIHIYRDQQVEERVSRRFDSFGSTNRSQQGESNALSGNPFVQGRAADVYYQAASRNRITLQVLDRVLLSLAATRGRKSLILVSQGFIYDPQLDEFRDVVQTARRSNVAMYFIDTRGLGGMSYMNAEFGPAIDSQDVSAAFGDELDQSAGAEMLASDSGGFSVKNTNDMSRGFQRIADETKSYYLVGYRPTNAKTDGKFRKIEVKVARKDVKVRARKGYFAPMDAATLASRKKTKTEAPGDPDIQAALDSPYEEKAIPLRMSSWVFDETLLGKANTIVATDVDIREFAFKEQDGRLVDAVEFLLVVAHLETGEFFRFDQKVDMKLLPATRDRMEKSWLPIIRDFELAPGSYQAKIVVRDSNSRRLGTVVHEFTVPDLAKLRASSVILSDTLQPDKAGEKPRPTMAVRRTFPPGATLYAQFEVYGAQRAKGSGMPKVLAGYQVRRRDGTVVTRVNATEILPTSLGKLSRLVGTGLSGAEPGDYEFVLDLRDEIGGATAEVREPFTIAAAEAAAASGGE
ncbi:MAG: VWA domain-containing protein [Vicinamibacteria bacterium]